MCVSVWMCGWVGATETEKGIRVRTHMHTHTHVSPLPLHFLCRRIQKTQMSDWSAARGMDFALAIQWLLKTNPQVERKHGREEA